ncbi:phosphate acetyltransferase [Ignatzschineria sp. F8392]|uniref:phosphate acetyltransferase n=1 Tax=Ignatzschineria sp. F8392 TaxID=1980117 RepID=UPI000B994C3B|nr:phosphate acetyltransferase [Ignatzschineria sp. F8392]
MKTLFVAPTGDIKSLTSISLALVEALRKAGLSVGFVRPIGEDNNRSEQLYRELFNDESPSPILEGEVNNAIRNGSYDDLLEAVVGRATEAAKGHDIVVVEGLTYHNTRPYTHDLNADIARTLCAGVVFAGNSLANTPEEVAAHFDLNAYIYSESHIWLAGYIINHVKDPKAIEKTVTFCQTDFCRSLDTLGIVPENESLKDDLAAIRFIAQHLNVERLVKELKTQGTDRMPPSAFRYKLIQSAQKADRRIVLPEGDEPRTLRAAAICAERGIARCVLLGDVAAIDEVAKAHNIHLPEHGIEIIDPKTLVERYVPGFVERRQHKGATEESAREALKDSVVVGTMMLAEGDVDGLVSGAVHTTADTIRPAFQLIGTDKNSKLVSSIFFMLMKDQVHVYGDCAVNPNPTPEQLADIAIQSAESAKIFGIEPRVAMLSYSTGTSGAGEEVEKVAKATEIAREKAPDLLIDGPLQFDAASVLSVGQQKAPNSPVAGRATVFIFPDLNTGNITYKAVQRSANVVCIGPMLQGLAKPVNDLSRGALVDDIVYTIAITALQATPEA